MSCVSHSRPGQAAQNMIKLLKQYTKTGREWEGNIFLYPSIRPMITNGSPQTCTALSWRKSKETKGACQLALEGIASGASHPCQVPPLPVSDTLSVLPLTCPSHPVLPLPLTYQCQWDSTVATCKVLPAGCASGPEVHGSVHFWSTSHNL